MIKVLSAQQIPGADYCTWEEFSSWLDKLGEYQFDIETNVTQWWCTKEVKTLQFGDVENKIQYVLEWAILTAEQKAFIKESLEDWNVCKLIQNAAFEYIVMRFHGMEIHNVYCTMVAEKVLNGGIELMNYSLSELTEKYIGISMDKTLQTAFGDGILTLPKIEYAATDCMYLGEIRRLQLLKIQEWKTEMVQHPEKVLELEMEALLAFSDCTYYGVELNVDKWRENITLAQPVVDKAEQDLQDWVLKDERLKNKAIELGFYLTEAKVVFNLNAPQQKSKLLQLIFPDIVGGTKTVVKAYIREHGNIMPLEKLNILVSLQSKDTAPFSEYLIKQHSEYLLQEKLLIPAGSFTINWNSTDQVLALVKAVEPKLKNLSADAVAKTTHPIFLALEEYKDTLKLLSSYGEAFIEKWVEPDGKVRTNYNQVVSTGRSSSLKPNLQNIPSKEHLENRYRHPFIPPAESSFVGSDFKGQELACIAHIANDEVWFQAILHDQDLHSVTAAMVFGSKWAEAEESNCLFATSKQKCKCKKHKTMRAAIKTINFGLCYGMSEYKLKEKSLLY